MKMANNHCKECGCACTKCSASDHDVHLHVEIENLKQRLVERDNHIVTMETNFLNEANKFPNGELVAIREELVTWQDKYKRLYEAHRRVQRVNQGLEDKLLRLVDVSETDKNTLTKDVATLSHKLAEANYTIKKLTEDNERYKNDVSLAIQFLQCKPANFVSQKFDTLPNEVQAKVSTYMANKRKPEIERKSPPEVKSIKVPIPTFPPTAMVYSIPKAQTQSSQPEEKELDAQSVDIVSAAIMAKVLEERERERSCVKHCDTCACAKGIKIIHHNTGFHTVGTQTNDNGGNSLCLSCNSNLESLSQVVKIVKNVENNVKNKIVPVYIHDYNEPSQNIAKVQPNNFLIDSGKNDCSAKRDRISQRGVINDRGVKTYRGGEMNQNIINNSVTLAANEANATANESVKNIRGKSNKSMYNNNLSPTERHIVNIDNLCMTRRTVNNDNLCTKENNFSTDLHIREQINTREKQPNLLQFTQIPTNENSPTEQPSLHPTQISVFESLNETQARKHSTQDFHAGKKHLVSTQIPTNDKHLCEKQLQSTQIPINESQTQPISCRKQISTSLNKTGESQKLNCETFHTNTSKAASKDSLIPHLLAQTHSSESQILNLDQALNVSHDYSQVRYPAGETRSDVEQTHAKNNDNASQHHFLSERLQFASHQPYAHKEYPYLSYSQMQMSHLRSQLSDKPQEISYLSENQLKLFQANPHLKVQPLATETGTKRSLLAQSNALMNGQHSQRVNKPQENSSTTHRNSLIDDYSSEMIESSNSLIHHHLSERARHLSVQPLQYSENARGINEGTLKNGNRGFNEPPKLFNEIPMHSSETLLSNYPAPKHLRDALNFSSEAPAPKLLRDTLKYVSEAPTPKHSSDTLMHYSQAPTTHLSDAGKYSSEAPTPKHLSDTGKYSNEAPTPKHLSETQKYSRETASHLSTSTKHLDLNKHNTSNEGSLHLNDNLVDVTQTIINDGFKAQSQELSAKKINASQDGENHLSDYVDKSLKFGRVSSGVSQICHYLIDDEGNASEIYTYTVDGQNSKARLNDKPHLNEERSKPHLNDERSKLQFKDERSKLHLNDEKSKLHLNDNRRSKVVNDEWNKSHLNDEKTKPNGKNLVKNKAQNPSDAHLGFNRQLNAQQLKQEPSDTNTNKPAKDTISCFSNDHQAIVMDLIENQKEEEKPPANDYDVKQTQIEQYFTEIAELNANRNKTGSSVNHVHLNDEKEFLVSYCLQPDIEFNANPFDSMNENAADLNKHSLNEHKRHDGNSQASRSSKSQSSLSGLYEDHTHLNENGRKEINSNSSRQFGNVHNLSERQISSANIGNVSERHISSANNGNLSDRKFNLGNRGFRQKTSSDVNDCFSTNNEHLSDRKMNLSNLGFTQDAPIDRSDCLSTNKQHLSDTKEHLSNLSFNGKHTSDVTGCLSTNKEHLSDKKEHLSNLSFNGKHTRDVNGYLSSSKNHLSDRKNHLSNLSFNVINTSHENCYNKENLSDMNNEGFGVENANVENGCLSTNQENVSDTKMHLSNLSFNAKTTSDVSDCFSTNKDHLSNLSFSAKTTRDLNGSFSANSEHLSDRKILSNNKSGLNGANRKRISENKGQMNNDLFSTKYSSDESGNKLHLSDGKIQLSNQGSSLETKSDVDDCLSVKREHFRDRKLHVSNHGSSVETSSAVNDCLSVKMENLGDRKAKLSNRESSVETTSNVNDSLSSEKEHLSDRKVQLSNRGSSAETTSDINDSKKEHLADRKMKLSNQGSSVETTSNANDCLSFKYEHLSDGKIQLSNDGSSVETTNDCLSTEKEHLRERKIHLSNRGSSVETPSDLNDYVSANKGHLSDRKKKSGVTDCASGNKEDIREWTFGAKTSGDARDCLSANKEHLSDSKKQGFSNKPSCDLNANGGRDSKIHLSAAPNFISALKEQTQFSSSSTNNDVIAYSFWSNEDMNLIRSETAEERTKPADFYKGGRHCSMRLQTGTKNFVMENTERHSKRSSSKATRPESVSSGESKTISSVSENTSNQRVADWIRSNGGDQHYSDHSESSSSLKTDDFCAVDIEKYREMEDNVKRFLFGEYNFLKTVEIGKQKYENACKDDGEEETIKNKKV